MHSDQMLAIRQQVARYSYTFDSGDAEGWANVFTKDGIWEFYAAGATTPATRLVGHDALRDFCLSRFTSRPKGMTSYHHQSGIIFDELTTNQAKVRAMVIITTQPLGEQPRLYMTGIYEDLWVLEDNTWLIKYRVLRP